MFCDPVLAPLSLNSTLLGYLGAWAWSSAAQALTHQGWRKALPQELPLPWDFCRITPTSGQNWSRFSVVFSDTCCHSIPCANLPISGPFSFRVRTPPQHPWSTFPQPAASTEMLTPLGFVKSFRAQPRRGAECWGHGKCLDIDLRSSSQESTLGAHQALQQLISRTGGGGWSSPMTGPSPAPLLEQQGCLSSVLVLFPNFGRAESFRSYLRTSPGDLRAASALQHPKFHFPALRS